jgi:hypothetical protein
MRKVLAAVFGVLTVFALAFIPASSASAASSGYYGSGPVECVFPGVNYNYTLVALIVQYSGRNNRAFQIGYGRALAGQRDNSEVIKHVKMDEYTSAKKHAGHTYYEARNDKGGYTRGMSTYYSPYLPSNQWTHETVVLTNSHGSTCVAKFHFHR